MELRRVRPDPQRCRVVLVHACVPISGIVCVCETHDVVCARPRAMWRLIGEDASISRAEFFAYFRGAAEAHAIRFGSVHRLETPLGADRARRIDPAYCAPQSYRYVPAESPLVRAVMRSAGLVVVGTAKPCGRGRMSSCPL